jgi:hypothetical protein
MPGEPRARLVGDSVSPDPSAEAQSVSAVQESRLREAAQVFAEDLVAAASRSANKTSMGRGPSKKGLASR